MDTEGRNYLNKESQAKPSPFDKSQPGEHLAAASKNPVEVDTVRYSLEDTNFVSGYDEEGKPISARALRTIEGMPNRLLRIDFPKIKDPALGFVVDNRTRELERLNPAEQQEYLKHRQILRNKVFTELRDNYGIGIPKFWSWIGRQNLGEGQSRLGSFTLVEKIEALELTSRNIPEEAIPAIADCYSKLGAYFLDKAKNMNWDARLEDIKPVPAQFHYSKEEKKIYMLDIGMESIVPGGGDWGDTLEALHLGGEVMDLIDSLKWLERNRFKKEVFADLKEQLKRIENEIKQIAFSATP